MKIAVFGASGRTRSLVVNEVLKRGHQVIAVTRATLNYEPIICSRTVLET